MREFRNLQQLYAFFARPGTCWTALRLLQKRLQNQNRRHLVHLLDVLLAWMSRFIQNLVGLAACQSLVMQVNGHASQFTELAGKLTRAQGLAAHLAGKMQRVSNNNARNAVPPREPRDGSKVLPGVWPAHQRHHRVSHDPQLITDSNADPLLANIERQIARLLRCIVHNLRINGMPQCPNTLKALFEAGRRAENDIIKLVVSTVNHVQSG